MNKNELKIEAKKTKAVIMKGRRKRGTVILRINQVQVMPEKAINYLGVWLDDRCIFYIHIKETIEKAEKIISQLARNLPNIGGPNP